MHNWSDLLCEPLFSLFVWTIAIGRTACAQDFRPRPNRETKTKPPARGRVCACARCDGPSAHACLNQRHHRPSASEPDPSSTHCPHATTHLYAESHAALSSAEIVSIPTISSFLKLILIRPAPTQQSFGDSARAGRAHPLGELFGTMQSGLQLGEQKRAPNRRGDTESWREGRVVTARLL